IPVVVIDHNLSKVDLTQIFSGTKTILDQAFKASDTTPETLAEYVYEILRGSAKGTKHGSLKDTPPPVIFQAANQIGLTGVISFDNDGEKREVFFDTGQVVFASSNIQNDLFGQFLCQKGFISQSQVDEALIKARKAGVAIGEMLVKLGWIKVDI